MTLPTREEIARIIHAQIVAGDLARSDRHHTFETCGVQATYYRIADALLARLRPAWEAVRRDERARNAAEFADGAGHYWWEQTRALRADLHACAEALRRAHACVTHDFRDGTCQGCYVSDVLSRPGGGADVKPFRVTTHCALCDYTIVTVRESTETEEEFFARREDDAVRLAEHVQREHPEVRERYIILRRDQRE